MQKKLKTIRTDVVGSLLRPAELWSARTRFDQGTLSREDLTQVENEAIRKAIELQQAVGLDVVTDGEFRRLNFQDSFGEAVGGYDSGRATLDLYERQSAGARAMSRFEVPLDQPLAKGNTAPFSPPQYRPGRVRFCSLHRQKPRQGFARRSRSHFAKN